MKSPNLITPIVEDFAKSIVPDGVLVYVAAKPLPRQKVSECFDTVLSHMVANGGEIVLGWCLYEWPKAYLTAELHAVWQSPDKSLLDIARRKKSMNRILFLPDPSAKIPVVQEMNRFWPLCDDPLVFRHIANERNVHEAGNPSSRLLVDTQELGQAQDALLATQVEMASVYGWPSGTTFFDRIAIQMCAYVSRKLCNH